jgi:hypothetical protein
VPDANTKDYSSFTVPLTSFTVSDGKSVNQDYLSSAIPVLLDSGTTLTYLPPSLVTRIFDVLDIVDDSQNTGLVYANCDLLSDMEDTTFDFRFGGNSGPLIRVPMDEMVLDNVKGYIALGLQVPDLPFDNVCSFGIQALSGFYLLGDTFLRSAYVVYDLSNKEIALAQANLNATDSHILEITKSSGIPLVSGVASQMSATQSPTGSEGSTDHSNPTGDDNDATSTSTASQTPTGSDSPSKSDNSNGASGPGDSNRPAESDAGNAGPRAAPAMWGAGAVTLLAALWSIAGAALFLL